MPGSRSLHVAVVGLVAVCACSATSSTGPGIPHASPVMTVTSPSFGDGGTIPVDFTCDGSGASPSLSWTGVPPRARALALVVDDPDAPGATFVHWIELDIPVDVTSTAEGAAPAHSVPAKNSAGRLGYTGPCPPRGTHHYRFTVYALSAPTGLPRGVEPDRAIRAVAGRALAQGRLMGTYTRR